MRMTIIVLLVLSVLVLQANATDCTIECTNGDRIDATNCRWEGDRLYFIYNGKNYVFDRSNIVSITNKDEEGPTENSLDCSMYETMVNNNKNGGLIIEIRSSHHFYVSLSWYGLPLRQKEMMARIFSEYAKCQTSLGWAIVHDGHTGEELAKYVNGIGFTSYE